LSPNITHLKVWSSHRTHQSLFSKCDHHTTFAPNTFIFERLDRDRSMSFNGIMAWPSFCSILSTPFARMPFIRSVIAWNLFRSTLSRQFARFWAYHSLMHLSQMFTSQGCYLARFERKKSFIHRLLFLHDFLKSSIAEPNDCSFSLCSIEPNHCSLLQCDNVLIITVIQHLDRASERNIYSMRSLYDLHFARFWAGHLLDLSLHACASLDFEPIIHSRCHCMTFHSLDFEHAIRSILTLPLSHTFEC
jgi:hypothetical protein